MRLEELLPDSDYRFNLRFERVDPQVYFGPSDYHDDLVAQRRAWLSNDPKRYAALLPDGEQLLAETIELICQWGVVERKDGFASNPSSQAWERCVALGCAVEPDFLLLRVEASRMARLVAGVVCFPSSWSLEEKIGLPITSVHEVVPGLNEVLGAQITSFLLKLRPGLAWSRSNWGLSRTPELNQHPCRQLARLDEQVDLDEVWLRVEGQILVSLPQSKGILFGIRIENHSLAEIQSSSLLAGRLGRALRTMPESVLSYKGLSKARNRLLKLLAC